MKLVFALPLAIAMLACGTARAEGQLHIYSFPDYHDQAVIDRFTETYGVEVTIDETGSYVEEFETLRKGNTGYDIAVTGTWVVKKLVEEGLLAEVRPNGMANFKNVEPRWVDVWWDPGRNYSAPYMWGTSGIAVDTAAYAGPADSLKIIFEPPPELKGKIAVVPERGDVIQAALRYLDKPRCTGDERDLKALAALLKSARPSWTIVELYTGEVMRNGEVAVAYTYNGTTLGVRREDPTWRYVYPREGYGGWADNFVVLKDAANLGNAKLFLNFMMDPEIAAMSSESEFIGLANAIAGSEKFLPPEFLEAPEITIPQGTPLPEFVPLCPQAVLDSYAAIWAEATK
jgi:spermidine/putrescine transport system substrate-binding protein